MLEFIHFLVDKVRNEQSFRTYEMSTEEHLTVRIKRLYGLNTNNVKKLSLKHSVRAIRS